MGIFNLGKKDEDKAPQDAQAAPAPAPESGDEMKKCEMCGEMKSSSEGKMMLEGAAFRCNDCAAKADEKDDHGEVCEFC